jgi:transcriptional regulator with XRE-family HTH domain
MSAERYPLKQRRKALNLTQEQVAQQCGTTKATIMKLERGQMQLTMQWLERLAIPLQCRPSDLLPFSARQGVPLLGTIKGRGEASLFAPLPNAYTAGETSNIWQGLEQVEAPPESGYRHLFALRVQDDGLEPFLRAGSLVYAAEPSVSGFDTFLNQLALCQTEENHWTISRIVKGYHYGLYNLISLQGLVKEDCKPICMARIIFFKPA